MELEACQIGLDSGSSEAHGSSMNIDENRSSFSRGIVKGIFLAVLARLRLRPDYAASLLLMMLLALPIAVQAQFNCTNINGSITITKYTGSGGAVTIPSTINGLPVASIGSQAFKICFNLRTVTIPSSVTNVGHSAFYGCISLREVYFQGNAPSAGNDVFFLDNHATVYYLAGTTGWGSIYGGRPTALKAP